MPLAQDEGLTFDLHLQELTGLCPYREPQTEQNRGTVLAGLSVQAGRKELGGVAECSSSPSSLRQGRRGILGDQTPCALIVAQVSVCCNIASPWRPEAARAQLLPTFHMDLTASRFTPHYQGEFSLKTRCKILQVECSG